MITYAAEILTKQAMGATPLPTPVAATATAAGTKSVSAFNVLRWFKKIRKVYKVVDKQEKQKKKMQKLVRELKAAQKRSTPS